MTEPEKAFYIKSQAVVIAGGSIIFLIHVTEGTDIRGSHAKSQ
jgi:hypothetical protein